MIEAASAVLEEFSIQLQGSAQQAAELTHSLISRATRCYSAPCGIESRAKIVRISQSFRLLATKVNMNSLNTTRGIITPEDLSRQSSAYHCVYQ